MKLFISEGDAFFTDELEIDATRKGRVTITGTRKKGRGAPARNYTDAKGVLRGTISAPKQAAVKASKGVKAQKAVWPKVELSLEPAPGAAAIEIGTQTLDDKNAVLLDGKTLAKLLPKGKAKGKAKGGKKKAA